MDNGTMLQYFEWYLPADASLWRRAAAAAPALAQAGFTAVWLPPAYKGAAGREDVGYGVYDLYDLGEFDQKGSVSTKYGTAAEYEAAVRALQQAGLQVLGDIVLDHRIGADAAEPVRAAEVRADDRNTPDGPPQTISAYTRFTFPGRAGRYSDFTWDWHCFDGVDWDDAAHRKGIFLFEGKQWDDEVDREDGNFDYLMGADLDMGEPRVFDELVRWGKWYLDTTGADGFRLDAVKHIRRDFLSAWLAQMRGYAQKELFTVGEYWSADLGALTAYLDGDGSCMNLFDVPLHQRLFEVSHAGGYFDMRRLLDGVLVSARPLQTVTFVDNHDTQPGQALQSFVEPWFKLPAYALLLLREAGYPCVFWGDLYGIPHDGLAPVEGLPALVSVRRAQAYGPQHDWFDHPDVVGWTREGDDVHPGSGLAALLSDGPGGKKRMFVGQKFANRVFRPVFSGAPVVIGADGWGEFSVDGGSVRVWVPQN